MQIVTSPPPEHGLIVAAVRYKSKKALWLFRGLGLLLLMVVVIGSIASSSPDVVGLLLSMLAIFGVPWLLVSRAASRCWRLFGTSGTYTIDEWGVRRHSTLTQHGYAWSALSGIDELPGQLIFTTGKAGFLPMSTAALLPGDREHILAMAAQNNVRLN
ncbi:hypothetical protein [Actinoplanes regularis]|uniref:hypothetical protein n=1 Tax=Actinoplanes regularis TaxID=52697 RepID=UPI002552A079|nr:hypothetical protein [Actinoplanes regularis]